MWNSSGMHQKYGWQDLFDEMKCGSTVHSQVSSAQTMEPSAHSSSICFQHKHRATLWGLCVLGYLRDGSISVEGRSCQALAMLWAQWLCQVWSTCWGLSLGSMRAGWHECQHSTPCLGECGCSLIQWGVYKWWGRGAELCSLQHAVQLLHRMVGVFVVVRHSVDCSS